MTAFHFFASETPTAQAARAELSALYGDVPPEKADVIVVLGGDGTMLAALHQFRTLGRPLYGMNRGHVGFLMNPYAADDLPARLKKAGAIPLHPLYMTAQDRSGQVHTGYAFNEVTAYRTSRQSVRLKIDIGGVTRLAEYAGDGVLVATPAGSTAYNLSARGPIIPMNAAALALTPISPFRPRAWRGALLPQDAHVTIENLDPIARPMNASADFTEVRDAVRIEVVQDTSAPVEVLFNPDHHLDERIFDEQFRG